MLTWIRERLQRDNGGVLVLVAAGMGTFILMMAFVIEAGNWWTHKRHLQGQADAAALAAAREFNHCTDSAVVGAATKFSGAPGATYNQQVGGTPPERIHLMVNSTQYFDQSSPVDSTVDTRPPCTAQMIDVKLTETDLPWFFRALSVPFVNAHARVAIKELQTLGKGALPVAVPESSYRAARAIFVDETTGNAIGSVALSQESSAVNGMSVWDNVGSPYHLTVSSPKIGVRIALSDNRTSTACGDPLVDCYDSGSPNGLVAIRGWDQTSTGSATAPTPQVRDATLVSAGCSDGYFSNDAATCNIGVSAKLDMLALGTGSNQHVWATVNGNATPKYNLSYISADGRWESTSGSYIPVAAASSASTIALSWEQTSGTWNGQTCTSQKTNPCTASLGNVQRHFAASDPRSGPLQAVQVGDASGTTWGENSYPLGSAHDVTVRVMTTGSLAQLSQNQSDPPVVLRVAGGGSQNQSLDCDPDSPDPSKTNSSTLKDEIWLGCSKSYTTNRGTACPSSTSALWGSAQPWSCVAIQTGAATNQVPAGMNMRIFGTDKPTTCTSPSHWNDSNWPDSIQAGDPRIVGVFLTPYGSFSGSGSGTVPVTGFATFYVTGWGTSGSGFSNPCAGGNGDDSLPSYGSGYIFGHFIKYVDTLNGGNAGSAMCDPTSPTPCVAQLVE